MYKKFINASSFIVGLIIALFISSCTKNEVPKLKESLESKEILSFNSLKEFDDVKKKVISMNSQELKVYEESQGYKSFGRMCDEVYNSKNPEDFKSKEEILDFVSKNSKYLKIVEDNDGELSLVTVLSNTSRYFINQDKLVQIGKSVYKVFETGVAMTDKKNIELLKAISQDDLLSSKSNSDIHFTSFYSKQDRSISSKDIENNCGSSNQKDTTLGRDRTILALNYDWWDGYNENDEQVTVCNVYAVVRPQKKTLGVWFNCTRTMWSDINLAVDNYKDSSWDRTFFYASDSEVYTSALQYEFNDLISTGYWIVPYFHFGGYDNYGASASIGPVIQQCNIGLF